MKRVAVLTSGGDAPGMNAAIRSTVRYGQDKGIGVFGVERGFNGLLSGALRRLGSRDVSGILQEGGTFLGTARCSEFKTEEGQAKALDQLSRHQIDALIVIGGNGSQQGSFALSRKGFPVVGVASTIDNDLTGSDITIGVDTALNIALEAIDRLKVTASSHQRGLVVEVMGRDCGYLALIAGLTGGAEAVVIPERETEPGEIARVFHEAYAAGKKHALAVVAEGARCNAQALIDYFRQQRQMDFEIRATILGHVQRGGSPTASDRLLASRLGAGAIDVLLDGHSGVLVGLLGGQIGTTPLEVVTDTCKPLDLELLDLAAVLS
jgi:6-phosphofructokinase 1